MERSPRRMKAPKPDPIKLFTVDFHVHFCYNASNTQVTISCQYLFLWRHLLQYTISDRFIRVKKETQTLTLVLSCTVDTII